MDHVSRPRLRSRLGSYVGTHEGVLGAPTPLLFVRGLFGTHGKKAASSVSIPPLWVLGYRLPPLPPIRTLAAEDSPFPPPSAYQVPGLYSPLSVA